MNKRLGFWTICFLWFGAAISIAEMLTGGLIAPLGIKKGIIIILIGHIIGTGILMLCGIIGFRENLPAIKSTELSFGKYGTYLFSILNILQLIGWTAVMIRAASDSMNIIMTSMWNFNSTFICTIFIGILTVIWIYLGKSGMEKLNVIAVALLFILTLVLAFNIFKDGLIFTKVGEGEMSLGGALELNIVMPLSWLPLIADYTRFAKNEKSAGLGSFIGYFLGSSWMFIIGLGSAIISNNQDPSSIMLAYNLGVVALAIVILSTITTTFLDVYSAGVSFINIMPKLNERNVGIVMTVIGTVVALVFNMENYEGFLYAIGSVFAPLFAILITDYFIIKENRKNKENVLLNVGAIIVWIIGIALYYIFIKFDFIIGSTVPVMILTSIIYLLTSKFISKLKIIK